MSSPAERYFALTKEQQKRIQIDLCERAYVLWLAYVEENGMEEYFESVCGTTQKIDRLLPQEAIAAVKQGKDEGNIATRYREPIAAMQDDDLEFADEAEFAYYAIYNLFRFHVEQKLEDSWLIVNQALSALGEKEASHHLEVAIEQVTQGISGMTDTAVFARTSCVICGRRTLRQLFNLLETGVPHGDTGHNFTHAYTVLTVCDKCGHGQLEKYSHDCFHYYADEDWDMYWWYVLSPADVLRLCTLLDSCADRLNAQCHCALHRDIQGSSERLWGDVKHAIAPNGKTDFVWLNLAESAGHVMLKVDKDKRPKQAA